MRQREGQTDGHTDTRRQQRPRLRIASRGKNYQILLVFISCQFLPRDAMRKRGLCCRLVSVCQSVCPSFLLGVNLTPPQSAKLCDSTIGLRKYFMFRPFDL